jgi:hypothetical protein
MPFSDDSLTVTSCSRTLWDVASEMPVELRCKVDAVERAGAAAAERDRGAPWSSPVGLVPRSVSTLLVASSLPWSETLI